MFKIHFVDNYGSATIECNTLEKFQECYKNLQADPTAEDIWVEYPEEIEG